MSSIKRQRVEEVVDYALAEGDEAAQHQYEISHETLRRYKRYYRSYRDESQDVQIEQPTSRVLREIQERYTDKELQALAKGALYNAQDNRTVDIGYFQGDTIRFGVLTDTHIGSKHFREDWYMGCVDRFHNAGVDFVMHVGDITEGMSNRPGHIYELTHLGYSEQRDEAVRLMSKMELPMYAIDGNHDRWFTKSNGAKIVPDICDRVPNMHFLGHDTGDLHVNGITIQMWHGEDGSCFDDQTEIMTKSGWKMFADLSESDEVATMTKSGHVFEWQRPTSIYKKHYDGDMIHFKSRTVDCKVTPNHGMWTRVYNGAVYRRKKDLAMPSKSHRTLNTAWHRRDARDLVHEYQRQKWQFTKVCDAWRGNTPETVNIDYRESKNKGVKVHHYGSLPIDDVAELIAWYVTEGHARKSSVTISQYKDVNPLNHQQIIDLVKRIGGKYAVTNKSIRIGSLEMAEWLQRECGHMSRHKYLPEWLKDCGPDVLEIVIDTMIKGDGWKVNGSDIAFGYRSISPALLNDFAEIAIKCGYSVNFSKGDSVAISKGQVMPTVNRSPEVTHYSGMIYCCEVPNGLIHVRRNGKTLWTHNSYAHSYRLQKVIEALPGGKKPNVLLAGHVHKMGYFFIRNIHAVSAGCLQEQTSWMRGKRLEAHPGFWIIEMDVNDGTIVRFAPTFYPYYY